MAISIRPLHRSYCPLSCACVGARRAAGGVLRTIVKEKERGWFLQVDPSGEIRLLSKNVFQTAPLKRTE